ncbi:hypothetical protein CMsap09_02530 [Clavibacter michiganensis]|uniref:Uncharacterized protein n=1 Tax=Clavibacter michiganensis TaxID=28447 RepID=A0A251XQK0_9MICO|nr:hypothetical protein CMsap09_02530 [Clavibacter michiganensis]
MTVLIQDSARNNLASWTARAVEGGDAIGAIMSPFCSPRLGNGYHKSADAVRQDIEDQGGEFWFDASTHALQMPSVGDFRFYDDWQLWPGARGDLSSASLRVGHVRKVFAVQEQLGARLLGPTILLHSAQSATSLQAIELARAAQEVANGREFWLSIVGDSHFWASEADLDGFIGVMDQIEPTGWILSVARPLSGVPVGAEAKEVAGLMRTSAALGTSCPVIIGHGDLAALPAAAAGASVVGSGWDVRQRVLAYPDFAERPPADPDAIASWYARPTLEGLLGNMVPNEFAVLQSQRPNLATRLYAGAHTAGAQQTFRHHVQVINNVMTAVEGQGQGLRARVEALEEIYKECLVEWPAVQAITRSAAGGDQWVSPLLAGVQQFKSDEGWA